jgi:hypothetical protein
LSLCNFDYYCLGNFWYANCDHISALQPLENHLDSWAVEYFLFNVSLNTNFNQQFGNKCGYSTANFKMSIII